MKHLLTVFILFLLSEKTLAFNKVNPFHKLLAAPCWIGGDLASQPTESIGVIYSTSIKGLKSGCDFFARQKYEEQWRSKIGDVKTHPRYTYIKTKCFVKVKPIINHNLGTLTGFSTEVIFELCRIKAKEYIEELQKYYKNKLIWQYGTDPEEVIY